MGEEGISGKITYSTRGLKTMSGEEKEGGCIDGLFNLIVDGGWAPWVPLFFIGGKEANVKICCGVGAGISVLILLLNWRRSEHFKSQPQVVPTQVPTRVPPWR